MGDAPPFARTGEDAVRAGAWTTGVGSEKGALPEWMPHWDLSQSLALQRQLEVDLGRLYDETSLPLQSPLRLTVTYESVFTARGFTAPLTRGTGLVSVDVDFEIPGDLLAGTVGLHTTLTLAESLDPTDRPVAWRRGSVLWEDRRKVRLHGESAQFPTTVVDFSRVDLDPLVPWRLELGPDLALPAMGSIHLLLNERFPLVVEAATNASDERTELAVLRSFLYADVGRALVEYALVQEDLESEWDDDSLGSVLKSLVAARFALPASDLRTMRLTDPIQWSGELARAFAPLRDIAAP